jgi:hypothetical protein
LSDAEKAAKRIEVFDRICNKHGFTVMMLERLPPDRLAQLVGAEGFPIFQPAALAALVGEYVKAKNNGHDGN